MIILRENSKLDYIYADQVLLTDALLDTSIREASISNRQEVINQIRNKDFDTSPDAFKKSLDIACRAMHGEHLAVRTLDSLKRMKTFKVKGLNAGFALSQMKGTTEYSEIVAVHNASKYPRLGVPMLLSAEELVGKYLECFGDYLNDKLYAGYGFEVYKVIENVRMRNGRVDNVYFMKLKWAPVPAA